MDLSILFSLIKEWIDERLKGKEERSKKHLEDLKNECINPIREYLSDLKSSYMISERGSEWTIDEIKKELNHSTKWWNNFSFRNSTYGLNERLYEDLINHFPELYRCLENIEIWIRTKHEELLTAVLKLLETIENDKEYLEFKEKFEKTFEDRIKDHPYVSSLLSKIILFMTLEVDKTRWPNIYENFAKPLETEANRLARKFQNINDTKKVKQLISEINEVIEKCINEAEDAKLQTKLKGKCKYI